MWMGSFYVFGVSAIPHAILLTGIFITVGGFEAAGRKLKYFAGLGRGKKHE
jgi:hypothetical protein